MARPQKEVLFITDRNPRPYVEDRAYLARLVRAQRRNPQIRVWRENGELRASVVDGSPVIFAIRNVRA